MTRRLLRDAAWAARVVEAGVRLDLVETARDDYAFALLGMTITSAVSEAALSDDDVYPLLVRFWTGKWPSVDWPPYAPAVARRCATALAGRAACDLAALMYVPADQSLMATRDAIITDLGLTQRDLLAALTEHWKELADLEMPAGSGCSLLAFARHVLLEPLVGACAMIWSTLDAAAAAETTVAQAPISWDEWSPVISDDWGGIVAAELARLGRPTQWVTVGATGDDAADLLASARAALLGSRDGPAGVAASIVRSSGWPGGTDIIAPMAADAVDRALRHVDDVDPETDNDELVNLVQSCLVPCDEVLLGWVRDPSFGTMSDHSRSSRTGAEMLHVAADWLTWSLARAAVEAVAARRRSRGSNG